VSDVRARVAWESVDTASGYEVLRDGEVAGVAEGDELEWLDIGAAAGSAPVAPSTAEVFGTVEGAELSWSEASAPLGTRHLYQVSALQDERPGSLSISDEGLRAASSVTHYEMRRDHGA
jgi:hypothetical protein